MGKWATLNGFKDTEEGHALRPSEETTNQHVLEIPREGENAGLVRLPVGVPVELESGDEKLVKSVSGADVKITDKQPDDAPEPAEGSTGAGS